MARNFSSLDEFLPEDIFIVGYPKSGNTWFQTLIASLVFGVLPDVTPPELVLDLVMDVHVKNPFFRRYQTPSYFKTHHLPRAEYRNVVYLLRDGRDAMVSYWHFLQALQDPEIDFLTMVKTGKHLYPCKWHEHVQAWSTNPYQARMIVIKYEDLLRDPVSQLERFCAFSGIEANPDLLKLIGARASFDNLQAKERRLRTPGSPWPKDKYFYRRGEAGSFRDEMPKDVLAAFLAEARETLQRHGYTA